MKNLSIINSLNNINKREFCTQPEIKKLIESQTLWGKSQKINSESH